MTKYVYKIVNSKNEIEYIGETNNPKRRYREHIKTKGKFANRKDVKLIVIKEFDSKSEAFMYQCELQKKYNLTQDIEYCKKAQVESVNVRKELYGNYFKKTNPFVEYHLKNKINGIKHLVNKDAQSKGGQRTAELYSKKIAMYHYHNMEFIKEFKSIRSAAAELNFNERTISAIINGRQKKTKGYTFKII